MTNTIKLNNISEITKENNYLEIQTLEVKIELKNFTI